MIRCEHTGCPVCASGGTRFVLLGPLAVRHGHATPAITGAKLQVLLAALLLHAGESVSAPRLTEILWDSTPPAAARTALHNHVMRLRRALGTCLGARLRTTPSGYQIDVREGELDLHVFARLRDQGRTDAIRGEWAQAAQSLHAAMSLCGSEPLAGLDSPVLQATEVPRLAELGLQTLEWRFDADLRLGRHGDVIAELRRLTAIYPLRERFHAQLMLALFRSGRQAEALAVYQDERRTLIGEIGVEPGPDLRALHQRILRGDSALGLASDGQPEGARDAADPTGTARPAGPASPGPPVLPQPRQGHIGAAMVSQIPMRVAILVDAYNLYYAGRKLCGRGTPGWRWLDIRAMAASLVAEQAALWPGAQVTRVVYCTARISQRENPSGFADQDVYLKALRASGSVDHMEFGNYIAKVVRRPLATQNARGKPVLAAPEWPIKIKQGQVPVPNAIFVASVATWEEKGSDVNLASHLLVSVLDGTADAAVVVSNDSDLRWPVKEARRRVPVGVVNPGTGYTAGALSGSPAAGAGGHWWRTLGAGDYYQHQLPDPAGGHTKPAGW